MRIRLAACLIIACICMQSVTINARAQDQGNPSGISSATATKVVTISAGVADYIAIPPFEAANPGVKVEIDPVSPIYSILVESFLTQDPHIDLYRLNSNLGIHQALRQKGFFLDLSGNETIRNFIEALAPIFRKQLCVGEQVMGVPSFLVFEYPITLNPQIAEEIGLMPDEIPNNLLDLLRFVNRWEEKYGGDFPDYFPFGAAEASSYALMHYNPFIGLVLEMYKDTLIAQGEPLRYDTPLFYELLKEIEPWTYDRSKPYEYWLERIPGEEFCLFYSSQVFSDAVFADLCGRKTLINMPLTESSPVVQAYELECAMVNPATKQPDLAVELASYYAMDCQPELLRILCPNITEQYQRPNYAQDLQEFTDFVDQELRSLELAPPDERREREEHIALLQNILQQEIDNPYSITTEALDKYRASIAPYLVARGEGPYESELVYAETMTYAMKWLEGTSTMEEFGKGLDSLLRMVESENE